MNTPSGSRARPAADEWCFAWRGFDATGAPKRGTLIAVDAASARVALKRERIAVTELTKRRAAPRPRANQVDVTRFTRQLASLLRAGLPLAGALDLLAQAPGPHGMPRVAGSLARDLTGGARFADALARHPQQFGPLYCQLAVKLQ